MVTVHSVKNSSPVQGYHPVTRWLHAGLVLGVLFQLICAVFMAHPEHADGGHDGTAVAHTETVEVHHSAHASVDSLGHGHKMSIAATAHAEPVTTGVQQPMHKEERLEQWLMAAHRTGGVLVAWIVLVNLIWAIMPRGSPRKRQISVLFSMRYWSEAADILKCLPLMLFGKKPLPDPGNALSLVVEMLGLLTMTAMAVSGSIIWSLWAGPGNLVVETAELWMEIHAAIAVLLLLYLAGHVSMALLHLRSGDEVFARISPFGKNKNRLQGGKPI